MFGTRTSDDWQSLPGRFDALNLRHEFASDERYGIPTLAPCHRIPTELAAYDVARQRDHAAEHGGAIHFFRDDYRFENVWHSPELTLARVERVGFTLTPDFSVWLDMPMALQLFNLYRNRWCGAYWQSHGVDVIPTVSWSTPASFEHAFLGIERGSVVARSCTGIRAGDRGMFRDGMSELIDRVAPSVIVSYGTLRYCDGLDMPMVVELPTHWDRRRKDWGANGNG